MMSFALPMPCSSAPKSTPSASVVAAYGLLIISAVTMYHTVAAKKFSSVLTLGAMVQTFAFGLLGLQMASARHARGISARALALEALALICRLSSTVWLDGYLPVDASGDWMYQAVDICSLSIVLWLLYQVLVVHKDTYQEAEDSFPAVHVAIGAAALAAIFHPDMDTYPLFDALWMSNVNISAIAVMPQLWLSARAGGRMEALTSHYIAAMAVSQVCSGLFMWHAWEHITCKRWIPSMNHGIWAIAFAQVFHMILLADFAYYYIRSLMKEGIYSSRDLSGSTWV